MTRSWAELHYEWSYLVFLTLFGAWLVFAVFQLASILGPIFKADRGRLVRLAIGGVWACVLTGSIFWAAPREFRIVSDEPSIVATSLAMIQTGRVDFATQQVLDPGSSTKTFTTLSTSADRRPVGFASLISVAHRLTGYRPTNGHWINFVLLAALLTMSFAWLLSNTSFSGAVATLPVIAAVPLLGHVATSAEVDLASLFFMTYFVFAARSYAFRGTALDFRVAFMTALVLSHFRTEGILIAVVALTAATIENRKFLRALLHPAAFAIGAYAILPHLWHRLPIGNTVAGYVQGYPGAVFGPGHFVSNLILLARSMVPGLNPGISPGPWSGIQFAQTIADPARATAALPYPLWLFVGAIFGIASEWTRRHDARRGYVLPLALIGIGTVVPLAYFWGQPHDAVSVRFYLPLSFGAGLGVALALKNLRPALIAAFSILALAQTLHWHRSDELTRSLADTAEHTQIASFLRSLPNERPALLIARRYWDFAIYGHAVVDRRRVDAEPTFIETQLKAGTYSGIYAAEYPSAGDPKAWGPSIEVQVERNVPIGNGKIVRILKLNSTSSSAFARAP